MNRQLALAGLAAALVAAPVALAHGDRPNKHRADVRTLAVIGDIPYGDARSPSSEPTSHRSTLTPT